MPISELPSADELLVRYDNELRSFMPALPEGATVERDGPVVRVTEPGQRGFVTSVTSDLAGVDLDPLIIRQRDLFLARGEAVEWKVYGHDPAELVERLRAAGFEPEEQETVVIGPAAPLANRAPSLPAGIVLREVTERADLDRIAVMEEAVWNEEKSHLAVGLSGEIAADAEGITVVVAEAGDVVVSAGWIRYCRGTEFGTLWGGSTLPQWRGQGIYRALVGYRAALATERGYSLLEVDASDDSRPILQRNGFIAVTTTTPYVHPAP